MIGAFHNKRLRKSIKKGVSGFSRWKFHRRGIIRRVLRRGLKH